LRPSGAAPTGGTGSDHRPEEETCGYDCLNRSDPLVQRAMSQSVRQFEAREIVPRHLPWPSLTRWIATALLVHHRVVYKIPADIPAASPTFLDIERFNDMPGAYAAEIPLAPQSPR